MNKALRDTRGQFIPISAMVMFTIVVFMVAVVNVYKVSRAKLQAQNLADAAALHIAAQQAQVINHVIDRNEWLNHMGPTSQFPNINQASHNYHVFNSSADVSAYAKLVSTVNEAQEMFSDAYANTMRTAGGGAMRMLSAASRGDSLTQDIPGLREAHYYAWNSGNPSDQQLREKFGNGQDMRDPGSNIQQLKFEAQNGQNDLKVRYLKNVKDSLGNVIGTTVVGPVSLSQFNNGSPVGVMQLKTNQPKIKLPGNKERIGAGVMVMKTVFIPGLGNVPVSAKSSAYLVNGSGDSTVMQGNPQNGRNYDPTYWVKLAPTQ